MMPIKAKYHYTEAAALRASAEVTRVVYPWYGLLPYVGALMTLGLAYVWFVRDAPPWDGINPLLAGPVFCFLPLLTKIQVRRQFRRNPNAGLEISWEIDRDQLRNETQGSSAVFAWNKLVRVVETKSGFLLFSQDKLAHWLPHEAFSSDDDIDDFRTIVRDHKLAT